MIMTSSLFVLLLLLALLYVSDAKLIRVDNNQVFILGSNNNNQLRTWDSTNVNRRVLDGLLVERGDILVFTFNGNENVAQTNNKADLDLCKNGINLSSDNEGLLDGFQFDTTGKLENELFFYSANGCNGVNPLRLVVTLVDKLDDILNPVGSVFEPGTNVNWDNNNNNAFPLNAPPIFVELNQKILFRYQNDHDVSKTLNQADFDACKGGNQIANAVDGGATAQDRLGFFFDPAAEFKIQDLPKDVFFYCGQLNHCNQKQKVKATIVRGELTSQIVLEENKALLAFTNNDKETTAKITVTISNVDQAVWIGFGLGAGLTGSSTMIGGRVIVGLDPADPTNAGFGLPGVGLYEIIEKDVPPGNLLAPNGEVQLANFGVSDASYVFDAVARTASLSFTIDEVTQNKDVFGLLNAAGVGTIYAYGKAAALDIHQSRGSRGFLNLRGFIDPNVETVADLPPLVALHVISMIMAWLVFIPIGIAMPLYNNKKFAGQRMCGLSGAKWFKAHWIIQSLGCLLTIIGFGAIVAQINALNLSSFTIGHHILGLIVFILALEQVLYGACRPHKAEKGEERSRARKWFERLHPVLGYAAFGLAVFNCFTGADALFNLFGFATQLRFVGGNIITDVGFNGQLASVVLAFSIISGSALVFGLFFRRFCRSSFDSDDDNDVVVKPTKLNDDNYGYDNNNNNVGANGLMQMKSFFSSRMPAMPTMPVAMSSSFGSIRIGKPNFFSAKGPGTTSNFVENRASKSSNDSAPGPNNQLGGGDYKFESNSAPSSPGFSSSPYQQPKAPSYFSSMTSNIKSSSFKLPKPPVMPRFSPPPPSKDFSESSEANKFSSPFDGSPRSPPPPIKNFADSEYSNTNAPRPIPSRNLDV